MFLFLKNFYCKKTDAVSIYQNYKYAYECVEISVNMCYTIKEVWLAEVQHGTW